MNKGALGITAVGIFIGGCGYITESKGFMFAGLAVIVLSVLLMICRQSQTKDPKTGKPYYKCPQCGKMSAEEQSTGNAKYKCKICGYKW